MKIRIKHNRPVMKRMFFVLTITGTLFSGMASAFGQKPVKAVKELRAGNKLYEKTDYKSAEISYRKALEQQNNYQKAMFNLGDALYKQGKYEESEKIFQNLTGTEIPKDMAAKAYHNLGNSLLQQKKYQESIDAFKNSLRQRPNDTDTKYNLEYAKRMIQKQQQNQDQQQQQQQQQQHQESAPDWTSEEERMERSGTRHQEARASCITVPVPLVCWDDNEIGRAHV